MNPNVSTSSRIAKIAQSNLTHNVLIAVLNGNNSVSSRAK
jgi:hypothetical protein